MLPAGCSACSPITEKKVIYYNDTLEDESESWKAKYLLNETHTFITSGREIRTYTTCDSRLIITYKHNLSGSVSTTAFEYYYSAGLGNGNGDFILDREDRNYVVRSHVGGGSFVEQRAVFKHTINSICTPYRTVYIYHHGGTRLGENGTVRVTLKMDGKKESLELKSTG
jgi:hypothetical protein